jgi:hypothetical protein
MAHVISGNPHPAQSQQHLPFRTKLENHVRANISSPDVVLSIDSDHVCCNEQIVSNAAEEFAGRIELHERMFSTVKDVDVSLRIHRDAGRLDECSPDGNWKKSATASYFSFGNGSGS